MTRLAVGRPTLAVLPQNGTRRSEINIFPGGTCPPRAGSWIRHWYVTWSNWAHGMCPHHKTGPCSHCITKSCYAQISHVHSKAVEMLSSLQGQWWVITGSLLSQSRHVINYGIVHWCVPISSSCSVDCIRGLKVGGSWRQHGIAGGLFVKSLDCMHTKSPRLQPHLQQTFISLQGALSPTPKLEQVFLRIFQRGH